jgi:alpha-tubulin suppressor-like RCC1 family protein
MKCSESNSDYQFVSNIPEKVSLVAVGKFNITIVTEKNNVYRMGYSKDGHLGLNTDYSQMTRLEKVEDEE